MNKLIKLKSLQKRELILSKIKKKLLKKKYNLFKKKIINFIIKVEF